jgi:undecaprenyl-diphosphatase
MPALDRTVSAFARLQSLEVALCRRATRAQQRSGWLRLFRAASRLGDGVAWYALALLLPLLYGLAALPTVARMTLVGVGATLAAQGLKRATARPRPFQVHAGIVAGARALDRYSFPSGHTLHAVAFSVVVIPDFPPLAWALLPFTLLVAASRVALGLHYPTDVAAGALVGALLAAAIPALL